ncbi:hypothetical protein H5410_009898 [Solanum commersonii]|uniref:Uncharacterized protein n=1 Tax=Solanum commersonii TaxID=4109 RepID=A0A9J6AJ74_SOLCO|nr:hypothetical protein H5410_009898 [Solanum commersonii]
MGWLLTSLAPIRSSFFTIAKAFSLPCSRKASTILCPISLPVSSLSVTATAVGPAPLMVQPKAPASIAAFFTPSIPGISGVLLGSTILSEDSALPKPDTFPSSTDATNAPA